MIWRTLFDVLIFGALASGLVTIVGFAATRLASRPAVRIKIVLWTLAGCLAAPLAGLVPGYPHVSLPERQVASQPMPPRNASASIEQSAEEFVPMPTAPQDVVASPRKDASQTSRNPSTEPAAPAFDWRRAIVLSWGAGLTISSLWWLTGLVGLWKLLRGATAAPEEAVGELQKIGGAATARVRLLVSDRVPQPIACWWGRPTIVLPRLDDDARAEQLRWRLAHEWAHLQHGDAVAWHFATATRTLFFFQPLCWLLCRQLRFDQDLLADARAAQSGDGPADYASFLISQARARFALAPRIALGMAANRSQLHKRVVMLLQHRNKLDRRVSRGFRLAIFVGVAIAVAGAAALPLPRLLTERASSPSLAQGQEAEPAPPAEPKVSRDELSFAGKSFVEWKRILQRDLDPTTRIGAIKALKAFGRNGYEKEVAALMAAVLKEENAGDVSNEAVSAAASLGPPGLPVVKDAIENPNADMRRQGIHSLKPQYFKTDSVFPVLFELLEDADPAIRSTACSMIGKFKGSSPQAAPRLLEVLQKDEIQDVRLAALQAIRKLGKADEATTKELLRLLASDDDELSAWAAIALWETGVESKEVDDALVRHLVENTAAGKGLIAQELEKAIRSGERISLFVEAARQFEFPARDEFASQALSYIINRRPVEPSSKPLLLELLRSDRNGIGAAQMLLGLKPDEATIAAIREAAERNKASSIWTSVLERLESTKPAE